MIKSWGYCNIQESCHKYWPDGVDRTCVYGKFKVKMIQEEEGEKFVVRKFEMGEDSPYMAPVSIMAMPMPTWLQ